MRTSTIVAALVATLTCATTAISDDFRALLADLSFGEESPSGEPLTPTSPPGQDQFQQAPATVAGEIPTGGITLPDFAPAAVVPPVTAPAALASPAVAPPVVALKKPVSSPPPMANLWEAEIDFDDAFAVQESRPSAQPVGHRCGRGGADHCEQEAVCTPHLPPSLPSSTLYQYFRSNKCNSQVWDGYRQPCRHANAHLHGQCDCFKPKHQSCGIVYDAEVVECGDCDSGCSPRPRFELPGKLMPAKQPACEAETCDDCQSCAS